MSENGEWHIDVYKNKSILHRGTDIDTYEEGPQSTDAKLRYTNIQKAITSGYLDEIYSIVSAPEYVIELDSSQKIMIDNLVEDITSEYGRALIGITFLQMVVKSIEPTQSVRLHKANKTSNKFSWKDGISMRSLDSQYTAPFLREKGLLKLNKYGSMMTRTLAENYPYSRLYKAEMRGPVKEWMDILESLEDGSLDPKPALCYLIYKLKKESDAFKSLCEQLIVNTDAVKEYTFKEISNLIKDFYTNSDYSARAFEIALHSLMQVLSEKELLEGDLVPLSQMRSANKKHDNVGDIELSINGQIITSWDAKYGKYYLADEMNELDDKLDYHSSVELAGFVTDNKVTIDNITNERIIMASAKHNVNILVFTFDEWVDYYMQDLNDDEKNTLSQLWIKALVESLAQKRRAVAPIDEPCDAWVSYLNNVFMSIKT